MKKIYLSLFTVLFAFNANAFDLATAANQVADGANKTSAAIEAKKAKAAEKKAEREAAAAEKKAALEKKIADKKAAAAEKKAQREKAVDDAKNSLNNLKGAFSN